MKKVLAIILSIAMLFGVLAINTFAETTQPTVTVNSIEVELGKESDLTVTLGNFSAVKGMDLTISTEDDVEFKSVTADKVTLDDTNRTLAAKKIHIVDLVPANTDTIVITIKAVVNKEATIKVTGDLAESGEKLFAAVNTTGSITELALEEVVEKNEVASSTTIATPKNYFIPYGSLYNVVEGEYIYPTKDAEGNYTVTEGTSYSYTQYLIPKSGFLTFGWSAKEHEGAPAKQFGTYCTNDKTGRGTMVIVGDVAELIQKYSDNSIAKANEWYEKYNSEGKYTVIKINFNSGANQVRIYKFAQVNYMWQGTDAIEYAMRVYGLNDGEDCVGVGYYKDGDAFKFASELKGLN